MVGSGYREKEKAGLSGFVDSSDVGYERNVKNESKLLGLSSRKDGGTH